MGTEDQKSGYLPESKARHSPRERGSLFLLKEIHFSRRREVDFLFLRIALIAFPQQDGRPLLQGKMLRGGEITGDRDSA